MMLPRRTFLSSTAAFGLSASLLHGRSAAAPPTPALPPVLKLHQQFPQPVVLEKVELLKRGHQQFVRVRSKDGATGLALCNERIEYLAPILTKRVLPYFRGKDARDLEALIDGVYVDASNYKLSGLALWCCVGYLDFAIMDLLGKVAGKPVGALLGGVIRPEIPVYMSSLRRDTTPEQEVAWVGERIAATGSKAVKLKIGGRMSRNADASPGRTEKLVALARKTWGDKMVIQVDANGSYDAAKAIEVGRMLEAHGVYFYEEPCPFEDFVATKKVADALRKVLVAGGEQDSSYEKFAWMIQNRAVDIVQPDMNYNGGFVRAMRVARLAASKKMDITPHAPQPGFHASYMLHFASAVPNLGRFQEFRAEAWKHEGWFTPEIVVKDGLAKVPTGPGLGLEVDPAFLAKAEVVA